MIISKINKSPDFFGVWFGYSNRQRIDGEILRTISFFCCYIQEIQPCSSWNGDQLPLRWQKENVKLCLGNRGFWVEPD